MTERFDPRLERTERFEGPEQQALNAHFFEKSTELAQSEKQLEKFIAEIQLLDGLIAQEREIGEKENLEKAARYEAYRGDLEEIVDTLEEYIPALQQAKEKLMDDKVSLKMQEREKALTSRIEKLKREREELLGPRELRWKN